MSPAPRGIIAGFVHDAQRIGHLAWPVLVGQLAVLAFGTIDTLILARKDATDLAALAVGSAAYVTVFVGLMGILLALGPIVGRQFGAQRFEEAGQQVHQGVWLALLLCIPGCGLLAWPAPFLWLSKAEASVAAGIAGYLQTLALALPAALLFTVYRGFNTAISRPKAVMVLQIVGLACKLPLSLLLAWGSDTLNLPALGVVGCGWATVIVMWLQCLFAGVLLRQDPAYRPFALWGRGLDRPHVDRLKELLALGIPMGAGILIEVTGFTFMAIFIARLGALPVAGHQIAANLAALLFMMPLALSNATSTLVAQRLGANDGIDARRLAWHGLLLAGCIALTVGGTLYALREPVIGLYTSDSSVAAAALVLTGWMVWFHGADALQTMAALVLRAFRIATLPVFIYAFALWGVGLGGGYFLAFGSAAIPPRGADGFWLAATVALWLAAAALIALMAWVMDRHRRESAAASFESSSHRRAGP